MTHEERNLWMGLRFCYDRHREYPEEKDECDKLAQEYIKFFWKGKT